VTIALAELMYLAVTWVRHSMPTQLDIHDIGAMTFNAHIHVAISIVLYAIVPVFIVSRVKLFVNELTQRPEVACQHVRIKKIKRL